MPATLVCKLNISRQFKLKYTVITRSDICAPEPAQIHRKLLYLLEQTASISKLAETLFQRLQTIKRKVMKRNLKYNKTYGLTTQHDSQRNEVLFFNHPHILFF